MKRIGIIVTAAALLSVSSDLSAQPAKEKSAIKIAIAYTRVNAEPPLLKVFSKIKSGKKFEPLEGAEINVSFMNETAGGLIGRVKTDARGAAVIAFPTERVPQLDSLSSLKFIASIAATNRFDEQTAETEITSARIELKLSEADTTRKIEAKAMVLKDGHWIALPKTEIKIFVKRLFTDFPVGANALTTDESGEVSGNFDLKIPGDAMGNIVVGGKIDDSDEYGTVSAIKVVKWGLPTKVDTSFYERSLWAARDKTPLWLLIFPNLIIVTVWGIIFYLIYLIRRIRKIGIAH